MTSANLLTLAALTGRRDEYHFGRHPIAPDFLRANFVVELDDSRGSRLVS